MHYNLAFIMYNKKMMFRVIIQLIIVLSTCFFLSCAVNPVTGQRQLMLVSESQEREMGRTVHKDLQNQYGVYEDEKLQEYVESAGRKLEPHVHRPHLDYHFTVLDAPVPNAFAAPGGYVYVTRGLLALMNSEAELAGVLGHELGHISARHSAVRLSYGTIAGVLLGAASAVAGDYETALGAAGLGTQLVFLRYSRQDEYEADELGVQYARAAGYSPEEMIQFFRTLQRMSPDDGMRMPAFLSTHPLSEDRIHRIQNMIREDDRRLRVERDEYLMNIDGLVYGDNPRQGMIEDDVYYYPEMNLQLQIPDAASWKKEYGRGSFMLECRDDQAFALWQFDIGPGRTEDIHRREIEEFRNLRVEEQREKSISGYTTLITRGKIQVGDVQAGGQGEKYDFLAATIEKEDNLHHFNAFISPGKTGKMEDIEEHLASFRDIADPDIRDVQPARIEIKQTAEPRPLQDIFRDLNYEEELWEKTAILNAMELETVPARNQRIKLIRK